MLLRVFGPLLVIGASSLVLSGPASAQADVMKECGTEYQGAKAANSLAGKSWNQFLADCRTRHAASTTSAPAAAVPAAPTPAKPAPAAKVQPAAPVGSAVFPRAIDPKYSSESPGKQIMKTCLDQYNANKVSNGNGGLNWIMKGGGYYSECNKRLKG